MKKKQETYTRDLFDEMQNNLESHINEEFNRIPSRRYNLHNENDVQTLLYTVRKNGATEEEAQDYERKIRQYAEEHARAYMTDYYDIEPDAGDKNYLVNSKPFKITFGNDPDFMAGAEIDVQESKKNKKGSFNDKSYNTIIQLINTDAEHLVKKQDVKYFDAVCTLYARGVLTFTANDIKRVLANSDSVRANAEERKKIRQALMRLKTTQIGMKLESGEVFDAYDDGKDDGKPALIDSIADVSVIINEKVGRYVTDVYYLKSEPILMLSARLKGQIVKIYNRLLPTSGRYSERTADLARYLARRVIAMKCNVSTLSTHVSMDTLYTKYGIDASGKDTKAKNDRRSLTKEVRQILTFWVDECFIYSFQEICEGKGNRLVAFNITVREPKAKEPVADSQAEEGEPINT